MAHDQLNNLAAQAAPRKSGFMSGLKSGLGSVGSGITKGVGSVGSGISKGVSGIGHGVSNVLGSKDKAVASLDSVTA